MKLGVVLPIANGAQILSKASEHPLPKWDFERELALKAEQFGFDYAFTQVTLRGWGGATKHWDYQIDSLTLMAAIGAVTSEIRLIGSVAIPAMHPAMAAKQCAAVSEISNGRFDLNLVSGWNKPQYAQMGLWPGDEYFATRYDYAEEYATILKELWTTGKSSFKGKYYQLDDCQLGLMPEKPINLICAGQSDRGLDFTAQYGDISYILGTGTGPEGVAQVVRRVEAACERAQRSVKALLVTLVVLAETDEEAQAKVDRYVEHADVEAIATMQREAGLDAAGSTAALLQNVGNATFQNLEKVVGSPETVAAYFDELAEIENLEGVIMVFDEALAGIEMFGREVMPRMRHRMKTSATS
ncbi:LLM class flavin-dependent oxidoreductase [Mycolicibacterium thermoresistibile]|uniref:Pyrimidine utilization protein A n=2 Tax=Mycolicibacterium thermoresistibile TaxID=1797 RepID=G7CJA0_MYCT3|nr:LLM class flavin-dependent oxidoreductase [Mycolicibacterium thermoresistibile]EHI12698.1 pyrimidine utilization protein A [Mycolicibacterium thermoresistibile ATCC 19527]MCV7190041.1 LLM class flavin-dependent oxidoreductase [Mycolicibacterium thermoresistibile]GAT13902.1 pyrimidine utilization protein A [Mycolicibacterium thermoresistibile]SNW19075.1 alkanesulfonate monooxygenase [Mycolicibacterium thermoresistibile]